jgi:hypothetical protein
MIAAAAMGAQAPSGDAQTPKGPILADPVVLSPADAQDPTKRAAAIEGAAAQYRDTAGITPEQGVKIPLQIRVEAGKPPVTSAEYLETYDAGTRTRTLETVSIMHGGTLREIGKPFPSGQDLFGLAVQQVLTIGQDNTVDLSLYGITAPAGSRLLAEGAAEPLKLDGAKPLLITDNGFSLEGTPYAQLIIQAGQLSLDGGPIPGTNPQSRIELLYTVTNGDLAWGIYTPLGTDGTPQRTLYPNGTAFFEAFKTGDTFGTRTVELQGWDGKRHPTGQLFQLNTGDVQGWPAHLSFIQRIEQFANPGNTSYTFDQAKQRFFVDRFSPLEGDGPRPGTLFGRPEQAWVKYGDTFYPNLTPAAKAALAKMNPKAFGILMQGESAVDFFISMQLQPQLAPDGTTPLTNGAFDLLGPMQGKKLYPAPTPQDNQGSFIFPGLQQRGIQGNPYLNNPSMMRQQMFPPTIYSPSWLLSQNERGANFLSQLQERIERIDG